ncbi:MAG: serine protease [Patescibacteria group bacterium]|nr:serine protease [Patescibacteria group bacterium]
MKMKIEMKRFLPYLGITVLVLLIIIVAGSPSEPKAEHVSSPSSTSSTVTVVPTSSAPAALESIATTSVIAPAIETSSAPKKTIPKAPVATSTPVPVAVPVPVSAPAPAPQVTNTLLDAAATTLRAALVNIICYVPVGSGLHSISGSGVFIDPKGIILTNAHIAQYFLLADRSVTCTIRAGSPATDSYKASLIYISPAWLSANSTVLTQVAPSGTGEYDFAFLAVTKSISRNALPTSFPFIPLAIIPPITDTPIVIASYGAQFLASSQVQFGLFPTIVFGSVKDVFTFANNTIDVLALGGSAAAQEGSSGGGVADASGELVGTITTSTVEGDTSMRSLDAITASYIRAEYASEIGNALDLLLAQPITASISNFALQIPMLEAILELP